MKHKMLLYARCALLCGIIMLLCSSAAYAGCGLNHDYVADADNPYILEFLYATEEGDVWGIRERRTCAACGNKKTVILEELGLTVTAHDFIYRKDLGHGVDEHFHEYACSACGRSETRSFSCDGPPCAALMTKKPVEEDDEQAETTIMEVE